MCLPLVVRIGLLFGLQLCAAVVHHTLQDARQEQQQLVQRYIKTLNKEEGAIRLVGGDTEYEGTEKAGSMRDGMAKVSNKCLFKFNSERMYSKTLRKVRCIYILDQLEEYVVEYVGRKQTA